VTIVLGAYFVEKGFELQRVVLSLMRSVREYAQETRILFLSYVIAGMLVLVGIASSYVIARSTSSNGVDDVLVFLSLFTWWIYGAFFAREVGKVVEGYMNGSSEIFRILYGLMFSLSIAFIIYGMINYMRYILGFITFQYAIVSVFFLILGLVVAMLSSMVHRYFNEILSKKMNKGDSLIMADNK
jgi:putative membrane protein